MPQDHPRFWVEFASKVGPPVFAGTLVACLMMGRFEPLHGVLLGVGLALIGLGHWRTYHGHR
jgi:hypothetical protein